MSQSFVWDKIYSSMFKFLNFNGILCDIFITNKITLQNMSILDDENRAVSLCVM